MYIEGSLDKGDRYPASIKPLFQQIHVKEDFTVTSYTLVYISIHLFDDVHYLQ